MPARRHGGHVVPAIRQLPGRAAVGYLHDDGLRSNVLHLPVHGNGDGGVYTTAADVHALWDALFAGRIVSLETVAAMVRPHSDVPDMAMSYGLGFWLDETIGAVVLLGGDAGVGFVSTDVRTRRSTATVLCNQHAAHGRPAGASPSCSHRRPDLRMDEHGHRLAEAVVADLTAPRVSYVGGFRGPLRLCGAG